MHINIIKNCVVYILAYDLMLHVIRLITRHSQAYRRLMKCDM